MGELVSVLPWQYHRWYQSCELDQIPFSNFFMPKFHPFYNTFTEQTNISHIMWGNILKRVITWQPDIFWFVYSLLATICRHIWLQRPFMLLVFAIILHGIIFFSSTEVLTESFDPIFPLKEVSSSFLCIFYFLWFWISADTYVICIRTLLLFIESLICLKLSTYSR